MTEWFRNKRTGLTWPVDGATLERILLEPNDYERVEPPDAEANSEVEKAEVVVADDSADGPKRRTKADNGEPNRQRAATNKRRGRPAAVLSTRNTARTRQSA